MPEDSALFTFFNEHPVLPSIVMTANCLAFVPITFLLYISQVAPLHSNCRYILCVWILGYAVFFVVNMGLAKLDLENASGFMPRTMFEPPLRFKLYQWYYMCSNFCSLFEIVLSMERIVSIVKPKRYHFSAMAWKTLLLVTILMMGIANLIETAVHSPDATHRLVGYTLLYAMETSVLAVGIVATRVCRKRFEKMYGNATLTARYQAKEAYEMSKAMVPGYILSFTLKASGLTDMPITRLCIDNRCSNYLSRAERLESDSVRAGLSDIDNRRQRNILDVQFDAQTPSAKEANNAEVAHVHEDERDCEAPEVISHCGY